MKKAKHPKCEKCGKSDWNYAGSYLRKRVCKNCNFTIVQYVDKGVSLK